MIFRSGASLYHHDASFKISSYSLGIARGHIAILLIFQLIVQPQWVINRHKAGCMFSVWADNDAGEKQPKSFSPTVLSVCQHTINREWRRRRRPAWSSAGIGSGPCFKRSKTGWRRSSANWFLTGAQWQVSWCKKLTSCVQRERKGEKRLDISLSALHHDALLSVYNIYFLSPFLFVPSLHKSCWGNTGRKTTQSCER